MTEVPKIVHDRLRAAFPAQGVSREAHPDADLLAAFAEQALSAAERDGVLKHLSLCDDCREVVALALPVVDVAAPSIVSETETEDRRSAVSQAGMTAPRKLSKFAWPTLHWVALAAGIVVAVSIVLLHPGRLNQTSANPQVAISRPTSAAPAGASQSASSPSPSSPVAIPSSPVTADLARDSELAKDRDARSKSALPTSKKLDTGTDGAAADQRDPRMELAYSKKDSGRMDKGGSPAATAAFEATGGRGNTETVEVSGAAAAIKAESSSVNTVVAQNDAPAIIKSKPASQELDENKQRKAESAVDAMAAKPLVMSRNAMVAAKLAPTSKEGFGRNATWLVTGGVLQRSVDNGQTWQSALHPNHPLLCYATHGTDVWAGGQAATLYHSANDGITWEQVQPSMRALTLTADVTRIDLRGDTPGMTQIALTTSNHETWSSPDGGKTWDKK